jgi:hypothetical protein
MNIIFLFLIAFHALKISFYFTFLIKQGQRAGASRCRGHGNVACCRFFAMFLIDLTTHDYLVTINLKIIDS